MISIKNILVPSDFSEPSEAALRYGVALAEAFSSTLHVVHVLEEPVVTAMAPEAYAMSLPGLLDELERRSRERLDSLLTEEQRTKFRAKLVSERGSPFVEIVRYAREKDIDLLVMGTHGRGAIAHMLMGSVAERVVRKAPCPVLTVRPSQHEFVMP